MGNLQIDPPGAWPALDLLVERMVHTRAALAALQAEESALLAAAGDLVLSRTAERRASGRTVAHDLPLREITSELGAAMRLSDRTVQQRMSSASALTQSFPATLVQFRNGAIDAGHVGVIVDAGAGIDDHEARRQYEGLLLEAARFETPPRLRAIARVVAARLDPLTVEALQRRGHSTRGVRLVDLDDGMARLLIDLPATLAQAIVDRLTEMAREVQAAEVEAAEDEAATAEGLAAKGDGSPRAKDSPTGCAAPSVGVVMTGPTDGGRRSLAAIRADVAADLLLAGAPTAHGDGDALAAIRGNVQITIPVLTAAGLSDEPALLAGYGPIDRDTACTLAAGAAGWDRVMSDPHSGVPLAVDRYRPSAELRRFLRVRDERCRFPGCVQRPWRCDLDHTIDAALGGATDACNLANFCRRHHTVKHATSWTVTQVGGGVLEWRSITGRRYLDKPPSMVQFVASGSAQVRRTAPGDARQRDAHPPGHDAPPF